MDTDFTDFSVKKEGVCHRGHREKKIKNQRLKCKILESWHARITLS
jgi:hypothetical protein